MVHNYMLLQLQPNPDIHHRSLELSLNAELFWEATVTPLTPHLTNSTTAQT